MNIHLGGKMLIGVAIIVVFILLGWAVKHWTEEGTIGQSPQVVCKLCQDTGYVLAECTVCKGSKTNICKTCKGAGETSGIFYGKTPCKDCDSKGKTTCLICAGKGELRLNCPNCKRSGTF
jgi:hypothetical protein